MKTFLNVTSRSVLALVLILTLVSVAVPAQTDAATLSRELQFGMSGSDVSSLQAYLAVDPSIYPEGLVTGYFGTLTRAAVRNFQAKNGIATVGRVGPQTLAVLNAKMNDGVVGTEREAPIISSVAVNTTNTSATISWNTNENASGIIYYSTQPLVLQEGSMSGDVIVSGTSAGTHVDLRTVHSATITNLQANTTYSYAIYTRDRSGNVSVTWPSTFRTSN